MLLVARRVEESDESGSTLRALKPRISICPTVVPFESWMCSWYCSWLITSPRLFTSGAFWYMKLVSSRLMSSSRYLRVSSNSKFFDTWRRLRFTVSLNCSLRVLSIMLT